MVKKFFSLFHPNGGWCNRAQSNLWIFTNPVLNAHFYGNSNHSNNNRSSGSYFQKMASLMPLLDGKRYLGEDLIGFQYILTWTCEKIL